MKSLNPVSCSVTKWLFYYVKHLAIYNYDTIFGHLCNIDYMPNRMIFLQTTEKSSKTAKHY